MLGQSLAKFLPYLNMVGVAGKSKGCATCRRRKIGCDLRKPSCQRCLSSGKLCEGYEKYPVFVIRTANGLEKRRRLEEVKLDTVKPRHFDRYRSPDNPVHIRNVQPHDAAKTWFVSWFWEAYTPVSMKGFSGCIRPGWLQYFIARNNPHALDQAILAISLTAFGRTTGTIPVYQQGRRLYTRALQMLQMSLQNQDLVFSDEILAAVYLLMTYEVNHMIITGVKIVNVASFANRHPAIVQRGTHMSQALDVYYKSVVRKDITLL